MTIEELNVAEAKAKAKYESEINSLRQKYLKANQIAKVGDTVRDYIGKIKVHNVYIAEDSYGHPTIYYQGNRLGIKRLGEHTTITQKMIENHEKYNKSSTQDTRK